jgi:hypothetical protein
MAVHDVDVDQPRAGRHNLADLLTEAREVGREDRRRDTTTDEGVVRGGEVRRLVWGGFHAQVALSGSQTGFSIEWPQCWQSRSSEALMRTIVWCSPQSGHCETSS